MGGGGGGLGEKEKNPPPPPLVFILDLGSAFARMYLLLTTKEKTHQNKTQATKRKVRKLRQYSRGQGFESYVFFLSGVSVAEFF